MTAQHSQYKCTSFFSDTTTTYIPTSLPMNHWLADDIQAERVGSNVVMVTFTAAPCRLKLLKYTVWLVSNKTGKTSNQMVDHVDWVSSQGQ